jgi:carboxylesterase
MNRGALTGAGDPSPIEVAGGDPAVLAIHGYGGTPVEVALVTEAAASLGLKAHAPLLPGHGTNARDLARTRFSDWFGHANRALDSLAKPGVPVIVAGLSLGSLIAAHLAVERPADVCALALLANATRLTGLSAFVLRAIDRLGIPDFAMPKVGADIADPDARATHLTYGLQPMHAALEVLRAGERTEAMVDRIRCPVFIAHGQHDHVCPVRNARRIADKIGTPDPHVVILPRSFHIITRDVDRETLRTELTKFFESVLPFNRR